MIAGFQLPLTPFRAVVGSVPGVLPRQYGPRILKGGVVPDVIVTFIVKDPAHWPASGVKVYVTVPTMAVLIEDGLQVPVIPLFEIVGKVAGVSPVQ